MFGFKNDESENSALNKTHTVHGSQLRKKFEVSQAIVVVRGSTKVLMHQRRTDLNNKQSNFFILFRGVASPNPGGGVELKKFDFTSP